MCKPLIILCALSILFISAGTGPVLGCTSIMVGTKASADGSVMTSHTCDSHRTSSAIEVVPPAQYPAGATITLTKRSDDNSGPMERYGREVTGTIPQVAETYGYLNPAYACMNEFQVAIGESTFGGREELQSDKGLIDCETLTRLMLERATTARDAIRIGGALIEEYGWNDAGEVLTISDEKEAWAMEIIGPGKDKVGAIWAAQRVPDDHVAVYANAARIRLIDLDNPEFYMTSANVISTAVEMGFYDPESGFPFQFCYAYDPGGRRSMAAKRREWRALDLLAPSLKLHPESENYPFSVKPEEPVTPLRVMEIFRDTYEGTDYDFVKHFTVTDEKTGQTVKSPLANPFMPYDANKLFKINGGWGWRGERTIARWYTMYATITQSRAWLPDAVGGIVWFGYDNCAMTTFVPIYAGVTDLPEDYRTDGRTTGFSRDSAWWAFNRVATLAAHRWGDMRQDVAAVRDPLQEQFLTGVTGIDATAARLYQDNTAEARAFLTGYVKGACQAVVKAYWDLGDRLWTQYDEKW
ncbi:MAG: C69 family dipeptidase [Acidobacteria bacterium]|nr:C69 family dipeptidase [Acidobacteriota bacterium]